MSFGQINGSPINYHSINGSGLETPSPSVLVYTQQDAVTVFSGSTSLSGSCSLTMQSHPSSFSGFAVLSGICAKEQEPHITASAGKLSILGAGGYAELADILDGVVGSFLMSKKTGRTLSAHQPGSGLTPHGPGSSLKVH